MSPYQMNMYISILCDTIGICIPFFIARLKGENLNSDFKLKTLGKIISLLLVYDGFFIIYYKFWPEREYSSLLYVLASFLLTVACISVVAKFSPLKNNLKKIVNLPKFNFGAKYHIILLLFFFYISLSNYLTVYRYPQKVHTSFLNFIMLKAFDENPHVSIFILILIGLFAIIGEELVFRYYAINALRQKLDKGWVVVISSAIWTITHGDFSFGIFLTGLLLAYFYYETESLSLCIVLHFIYNFTVLSEPFYLLYKGLGRLTFTPPQYIMTLFVFQMLLYQSAVLIFKKAGHSQDFFRHAN